MYNSQIQKLRNAAPSLHARLGWNHNAQAIKQDVTVVVRYQMLVVHCRPVRHTARKEIVLGWSVHTSQASCYAIMARLARRPALHTCYRTFLIRNRRAHATLC